MPVFFLSLGIAVLVGSMAERKGYSFWWWAFLGMWFLGIPVAIYMTRRPFQCRRCDFPLEKDDSDELRCPSCLDGLVKSLLGPRVLTKREVETNPKPVNLTVKISPEVVRELTEEYNKKSTEELKKILATKSDGQYSDRAYRVIEMIVRKRDD